MRIIKLIPCLIMLFPLLAFSQYQISGRVVDRDENPMEFVNVVLLDPNENNFIEGTITDSIGTIKIKAPEGIYEMKISFLGYQSSGKTINLDEDTDLGIIELVEDATALQEVILEGERPLIEQKIDRLVFNVQNSIAAQGMSGMDALRNTPLVRVQESGGISIIGKSGVAVMVNDRMLHLSGEELNNYIRSLQSDNISRIEVITTPPAKYEAEGNSGLINIILKKNIDEGWSGTITGTYQRNTKNGMRSGITLNYQSGKIRTSLKVRQYNNGYSPVGTRDLLNENSNIYTTENREDRTFGYGLNYTLNYKLNDKSNIGIIYDFGKSNYNMDIEATSKYESFNTIDSTLITYAEHHWKTPVHTFSTYYDLELDSLGKKLSITSNILDYQSHRENNFRTQNLTTPNQSIVRNTNDMNYGIYSGQLDLTLPFTWSNIALGAKYTLFKNNSDVKYYDLVDNNYILNLRNSNVFDYKEQIYAAYLSLQKNLNEKWNAKAGLRYEYTKLKGLTPGIESSNVSNNYGKIFPSVYLSFIPNEDHVFSATYSKRINRPGFRALNPFRWYSNPYTFTQGNPLLNPSFNDNIELSYSFKNRLTASLYNQYGNNKFTTIARLEDGIYSLTYENSYDDNKLGLRVSYYDTFFNIWEVSMNSNVFYAKTIPQIAEVKSIDIYSLYYSIRNSILLNSEKNIVLMINFWHSSPRIFGNTYLESMYALSPGLKMSLLDNKLQISAVINDLFKTIRNDGYSVYSGYRENFTQYNDHRRFTISASYSFGDKKVKSLNKDTEFDEKSRAN